MAGVVAKQLFPLSEREVSSRRSSAPLIARHADIGASALEIPLSPLFVVVESGAWISGVLPSVLTSLFRPQLIGVIDVVATLAFSTTRQIAAVPVTIPCANTFSE